MISAEIAMGLLAARNAQAKSTDELKKVGIALLSETGMLIASGWNHTRGLTPPAFEGDRTTERRPYPIHAEIDLLTKVFTWTETKHNMVVTTLFPCAHCMTALAAINVTEVYYVEMYDKDKDALDVAKFYGITCEQIQELPQ